MSVLFYLYGLVALLVTVNALRRPNPRSPIPGWWLMAMIVGEHAVILLPIRVVFGWGFFQLGGWSGNIGRLGAWLWGASVVGLVVLLLQTWRTVNRLHAGVEAGRRVGGPWWDLTGPRLPRAIAVDRRIPYTDDLTLDILRRTEHDGSPSPTLVYVHGGGWTGGDPHRQARTMMHHLAGRGWVVLTIRYPLSPRATFPEHLVAVKRAVAWAKGKGTEWGVDPARMVLSCGSAGGHLASLAALTAANRELQPGFEDVDTSVAGCVPMYGVYDFVNRNLTRHDWPVIPKAVMKATPAEAPEAYRLASPLDQVHSAAPGFLVVHGARDSLVPPHEARQFVTHLEAVSNSVVEYLEVAGGQHAFDAIHSPRTRAVVAAITEFLETRLPLPAET